MQKIRHQTQPDHMSCMATCLAMLMGNISAVTVHHDFSHRFDDGHVNVPAYLGRYDILCKPFLAAGNHQLQPGKVYLATVPSLMGQGMFHQIIIDTREGIINVFDPGRGMSKKTQYYVRADSPKRNHDDPEYDKLAFPLLTFILDYEIIYVRDM